MARINATELAREIERELDDDPDISIRAIGRRLRARGIRAGNDRLRALARGVRGGASPERLTRFDPGIAATPRQARILLTELATALGSPALPNPSHIAISYEGTADVNVTLYGQPYLRQTFAVRGILVQPIEAYTPDLLAERVARQIAGQVSQQIGDGSTTLIEGIDIDILREDIRVISSELRGTRR